MRTPASSTAAATATSAATATPAVTVTLAPALALALALALAMPAPVKAATIGFDTPDQQGGTLAAGDVITADGFAFTQLSDAPSLLFAGDTAGAYAGNGSPTLLAANLARFGVAAANGHLFQFGALAYGGGNLAQLDPAQAGSVAPWAATVTVQGLFEDGSVQSAQLAVDPLSAALANASFQWDGLVSLQFSGDGDFSIDDLRLNAVPEPGSLALALAGLLLLGTPAARRIGRRL